MTAVADANITLNLTSKDGEIFPVSSKIAKHSLFLRNMLDDIEVVDGEEIPIPVVDGFVLKLVLEYCEQLQRSEFGEIDKSAEKAWEAEFLNRDKDTLFRIIMAANFLDIPKLVHISCSTVADMIRGKTVAELKEAFELTDEDMESDPNDPLAPYFKHLL